MTEITGSFVSDELLSDTITVVVQTYFDDKIIPFVSKLIASWSVEEEGRKDAFDILFEVTNDTYEESEKYLNARYRSDASDETVQKKIKEAKDKLLALSRCIKGLDDEVFRQCARFTDEEGGALKSRIGNFFQTKMNKFIKEQFPDLLETRTAVEAGVVANDVGAGEGDGASARIYRPTAERLGNDSKEMERF